MTHRKQQKNKKMVLRVLQHIAEMSIAFLLFLMCHYAVN